MIPLGGLISISLLLMFWMRIFDKTAVAGKVRIDMPLFFGTGWFLYSFFFMLEKSLKADITVSDSQFILDCNLAVLSMVIGAIFAGEHLVSRCDSGHNTAPQKFLTRPGNNVGTYVVMVAVTMLLQLYVEKVFGSWNIYFTQKYGDYKVDGINSFTSIVPIVCTSFVLVANSEYVIKSKFCNFVVVCFSAAIACLFFLGGNRNFAMMMLLAIVWSKYHRTKVNLYFLLPVLTLVIIVGAINAVLREYGIINLFAGEINVSVADINRFVLAISEGEFGTMARVSQYSTEFAFNYNKFVGASYLVDPFVNLLPTFIYPGRPDTMAVQFTEQYWGMQKGATGLIGLGFSPIVEAKINFSYLWFIVFVFFGFLIRYLSLLFRNKQSYLQLFAFGSFSVVSLNFFRIDFALYVKFSILVFISALFIYFMIVSVGRAKFYLLNVASTPRNIKY
ncbi:hypothetical protein [Geomonas agri]|uniref:hypothetical protein n=1 Tax=Geomonas agri TaxID=2873702 RepID=UPI001CD2F8BE|nr:hypothetical protein [Geomonas agri]